MLINWKHFTVFDKWFEPGFTANNNIRRVRAKEGFFFATID